MVDTPQLNYSAALSASKSALLPGDKITLPQSTLEKLISQTGSSPLPKPLTFRIFNPANSLFTHVVPREFSAEEGTVSLSPYVWEVLQLRDVAHDVDLHEVPRVTVSVKPLPKGTSVRLRPLEASDGEPVDWKPVLEAHLRDFSTLTLNEVLSVTPRGHNISAETIKFVIDKLEPEEAVSIVDTDLVVDIEPLSEEQARETLRRKLLREKEQRAVIGDAYANGVYQGQTKRKGGVLKLGETVSSDVLPGEYVDFEIKNWLPGKGLAVYLDGVGERDEVDLFVSPVETAYDRPRMEAHVWREWSSEYPKSIEVASSNVELEHKKGIYISVYGFSTGSSSGNKARPFTLRVSEFTPTTAQGHNTEVVDLTEEEDPDTKLCSNCKQRIPNESFTTHSLFCARSLVPCRTCKQLFDRRAIRDHWHCPSCPVSGLHGEPALHKHQFYQHPTDPLTCSSCGETSFENYATLAGHRATTCPQRLHICRFCHLLLPIESSTDLYLSDLSPHEHACGTRTTDCAICNKPVQLRNLETHQKHHDLDRLAASNYVPTVCRNSQCVKTINPFEPSTNSLRLCIQCWAPLYSRDNDPTGTFLKRRAERRYLSQVLKGCGKKWCHNPLCRTGRVNVGLEPLVGGLKGGSAACQAEKERLWEGKLEGFCVDEGTEKKRRLVDEIVGTGEWRREWVAKAVEEGGESGWQSWIQAHGKRVWEE